MMLEAYGIPYRNNDSLIYAVPEEEPETVRPSWRECEFISPSLFPLTAAGITA
jgi:hypothetical protein